MILTVTLNPAIDVTITVDVLETGRTQRVDEALRRAGGKGVNVARVLHGQGIATTVLACVDAGIHGQEFRGDLEQDGIPHRLITSKARTRTSVAIVERVSGRATVLNEKGEHPGKDAVEAIREVIAQVETPACLVVSGSLPGGMDPGTVAALVGDARERAVPVVVDGAGALLVAAAEAGAALLKPNAHEVREACPGAAGPLAAARELVRRGAGAVVITLGDEGMIAVDSGTARAARLNGSLHGNPTGAGDAATAALAATFAERRPLDEDAVRRAVAWSASAVLTPYAGELHPSWTSLSEQVRCRTIDPHEEFAWPS